MNVVALLALGTPVEAEAPLLATELAITAYEAGLMLRAPSPIPILRTDDRARALDLLGKLRARGHDAVACDSAAVATSDAMLHVRSFRLEPSGFVATDASGTELRIVWDEVVAYVRAVHRVRSERTDKSRETKVSLGRAALSGGISVMKTTTKETKLTSDEREQVLYLFHRAGAPWLVELSRARYEGLGADLRPAQIENFATLVRRLREHAPHAPYDERLLAPRASNETVQASARGHQQSTSAAVDLLAHLVALAVSRAPSPFR